MCEWRFTNTQSLISTQASASLLVVKESLFGYVWDVESWKKQQMKDKEKKSYWG